MINKDISFDYSVVIRTLGTSGEKYGMLLECVKKQTVQPREVVVVMADGYSLPSYHIEKERVVWTRKGMVNQRQVGFEESKSPYLLVLDDDISFDADFVERMYDVMQDSCADCIFPVTGNGGGNLRKRIRSFILGAKRHSSKTSKYSLRIGSTGGTIVNTKMKDSEPHWCQTANFQCFFAKRQMALETHLEEEMWLEDTGYAWPDDQVFFYKAYLKGFKTLLTPRILYNHLDAKSGNVKQDKTYKDNFLHQRNITIFWYRFLWNEVYRRHNKFTLICGLGYRICVMSLFYMIKCVVRGKLGELFKGMDGFFAAVRYNRNH